jgi:hypothetical protein
MVKNQYEQFIKLLSSGHTPCDALEELGSEIEEVEALRLMRKHMGHDDFTKLMHEHVMPNRIEQQLDILCNYVDDKAKAHIVIDRLLDVIGELRQLYDG